MNSHERAAFKGWCVCIRHISRDTSDLVLNGGELVDNLAGDLVDNLAGDLRILMGLAEYILDVQGCKDARRAKAIACVRLAQGKLAYANWHSRSEGTDSVTCMERRMPLEDALWLSLTAAALLCGDRDSSATLMADAIHTAAIVKVSGGSTWTLRAALEKGLERLDKSLRSDESLNVGGIGATGLDLSTTKCSLPAYHATFKMLADAGMRLERVFVPGIELGGSNPEEGFWTAVHDTALWKHVKEVYVPRAPVLRGLASEVAEMVEHLSIMGGSFNDVCNAIRAFTNLKRLTISGTLHHGFYGIYGMRTPKLPPAPAAPLARSIEEVVINTLVTGSDGLDGLGPLALAKDVIIDLNILESSCKPELLLAQVLKLPNVRVHDVIVCKSKCSDEVMRRIAEVLPELPCLTICIEEEDEDEDDNGIWKYGNGKLQLAQVGFYLHEVANLLEAYLPGLHKVKLQGFGCRATKHHVEILRKSIATLYDGLSLEIEIAS
jgi:hypothetical protein